MQLNLSQCDAKPLSLRPKDAARVLGIGQRLLWELTKLGRIPHVRLGRCVVYPVAALTEWLKSRSAQATAIG